MLKQPSSVKWNDTKIRLVFIPFCVLVSLYFVLDADKRADLLIAKSVLTFVIVIVAWHIGRYTVIFTRKLFPGVRNIQKRIAIVLPADMIITFFSFSSILYLFITYVKGEKVGFFDCALGETKQTTFVTMVLSLLVSAVYECIFFFNEWKLKVQEVEKYKKASLEAQYQNLKSQLKPHFLFNSINTLAWLIEENKDRALDFLQEFSDVYRYVLNSQEHNWVSLKDEMDFVKSYVFLLKMRHEKNLVVKYNVAEAFHGYVIPPLTLQMLVENAIKHNEISNDFPLFINIYTNGTSKISVENNVNRKVQRDISTKVGLKNICERYNFLLEDKVEIVDNDDSFKVSIPILKINNYDHERIDY